MGLLDFFKTKPFDYYTDDWITAVTNYEKPKPSDFKKITPEHLIKKNIILGKDNITDFFVAKTEYFIQPNLKHKEYHTTYISHLVDDTVFYYLLKFREAFERTQPEKYHFLFNSALHEDAQSYDERMSHP